MKIQELAIIFIIIILPISLLLSEYTQFQIQTIQTQTEYDTKLTSATYDAIKAFQLNTGNESYSDLANEKLRDLEASISTFKHSIKSAFELTGYTDEDLDNYIPALVYTLYDGFYIYSPYENTNYRYETDEDGNILKDQPIDGNGKNIYGLKPYINYSCRYVKGNIDVVITYALDNYITVQGTINGEYVNKSGYLIDNIEVNNNTVKYNGVSIVKEELKENVNGEIRRYFKYNGTKYYDKNENGITVFEYNSNGTLLTTTQFDEHYGWNMIYMNDSAQQYYKKANDFTNWFKETDLDTLTYDNAIDEVIINKESGKIELNKVWAGNNTPIFDFNTGTDASNNIENESSNFNQHRLAVIRHKIETNLAIAISNYNNYSGVGTTNVFQMPELKEDEWEHIINNISLISFLQGMPIGGKIYNGYSLVTNSESEEVVLEENIYILGNDGTYHRIGDKELEKDGAVTVYSGKYGGMYTNTESAGRLNLDFKRVAITDNNNTYYYYPLKDYNASYNSIVMQNNVTVYDDIYAYIDEQRDKGNVGLAAAFYTALGRERASKYNSNVNIDM